MRCPFLVLAVQSILLVGLGGTPDLSAGGPGLASGAGASTKGGAAEAGAPGEPQAVRLSRPPSAIQPLDYDLPKPIAVAPAQSASVQGTTTIVSETFEGSFPSGLWAVYGDPTWDDDDYKPYEGSWSAWCANGGSSGLDPAVSNYPNNMNAWMIYGPFSLADAQSATLSFQLWLEVQSNLDSVSWMASIDDETYYGQKLSQNTNGWVSQTLDLSNVYTLGNLMGQPAVWIAFIFQSNPSVTHKGAFVDNVLITKTTAELGPDIDVSRTSVTVTCGGGMAGSESQEVAVASPIVPATPDERLIDAEEILQNFANGQGRAAVIVNLARPAKAPARANYADLASLKPLQDAIKTQQDAVLARLPANEYRLRYRFENQPGFSAEVTKQALGQLKADPEVSSIEPVRILHAHLNQGIPLMNGLAYRSVYNGAGLAVAICDTGIDYTHPRLGGGGFPNSKVLGGYDFGDDDSDPMTGGQAHGTACAGIAAGDLGTVGDYIGGVAHNAKLYALKISPGGTGSATSDAMIAAWNWCVTHKNDNPAYPIMVISTSFGGGRYFASCDGASLGMTTAANNAVAAGMTLLVSSGNDGYCDSMGWPACISSVISVGAVYDAAFGTYLPCITAASCAPKTPTGGCTSGYYATDVTAPDKVTSYSNSASFLGVLAPSNACYTTDIVGGGGYSSGSYTTGFGGTSAACPYAAGAVAALQSAAKAQNGSYLTPAQVKSILTSTGVSVTDTKNSLVKPRVNLAAAIDAAVVPPTCFIISNTGTAALTVSSVTKPVWAALSPAPPYTIAAGASQQVCVEACASCSGCDLDAMLTIQSNDPDESTVDVSVHVDCPPPGTPTDAQASPAIICLGQSSTLSATPGGGTTIEWFTGSCGGASVGEGTSIMVNPTATTTYYARTRSEPCDAVSDCTTVTISVNTVPVDFNCDGYVDGDDLSFFRGCMSGPGASYPAGLGCERADRDEDDDVDQSDYGVLQRCFSGSLQLADPGCVNN